MKRVEREAELQEVIRFDDADGVNAAGDEESTNIIASVNPDAPLVEHLNADAWQIFRVRSLRPKQEQAITMIVADPLCAGKLIVVDHTGRGKSIVLYMTAFTVTGITLIIVPLLALTANQMARIKKVV